MARPINFTRLKNYVRDAANGVVGAELDPAGVDAELNLIAIELSQIRTLLLGITNASGALVGFGQATAQALAGAERFVATASQTVFQTSIAYDAAFTNLNVAVYASGVQLDPDTVTIGSWTAGSLLEVTLDTGLAVGTVVVIGAFSPGAGIASNLVTFDTAGKGTDLIGVYDPGALITATDLTTALQEIVGNLNDLVTGVGDTTELIRSDGTVDFAADQSMGGFNLSDLADGVADQDAVTVNQLNAYTAVWNALQTYFLRLDGTTIMAADLDMGANKITNIADGVDPTDAVAMGQLSGAAGFIPLAGGTFTGNLVSNGTATLTGIPAAVNPSDAVRLDQAQSLVAPFAALADYPIAGASSFIVPAGITKISVELWGAGAGGSTGTVSSGSTGGAGGGWGTAVISVTPSETLVTGVGAGGAAGANGGNTTISRGATVLLQATGGTAGGAGGVASSPGAIPFWGIPGQQGHIGGGLSGGIGANGAGGDAARGGSGGPGNYTSGAGVAGAAGDAPGGGGAGGGGAAGGSGAAGRIVIRY